MAERLYEKQGRTGLTRSEHAALHILEKIMNRMYWSAELKEKLVSYIDRLSDDALHKSEKRRDMLENKVRNLQLQNATLRRQMVEMNNQHDMENQNNDCR